MLEDLNSSERLQLMKFVCAFAWSDLRVSGEERLFVADCIRRLKFLPKERVQIWSWLEAPPRAEDIDPNDVPIKHRQLFIEALARLIKSDEEVTPEERETLIVFSQLLA